MLMLERRKICLQNFRGQQQNSPMADPTFGSKSGPQNGAQAKTHEKKKACVEPTLMLMLERRKICLQNFRGQQQNSPMADPTFGSKSGPQNGAQAKTHEKKKACVEPTLMLMLERRKICLQNFRGQQQNSPMADPTFGSKSGPQNGAQAKTHEKKVK